MEFYETEVNFDGAWYPIADAQKLPEKLYAAREIYPDVYFYFPDPSEIKEDVKLDEETSLVILAQKTANSFSLNEEFSFTFPNCLLDQMTPTAVSKIKALESALAIPIKGLEVRGSDKSFWYDYLVYLYFKDLEPQMMFLSSNLKAQFFVSESSRVQ